MELRGPTSKSNRLSLEPRPALLCLRPGAALANRQAAAATALGGQATTYPEPLAPALLADLSPAPGGVLYRGDAPTARTLAAALAAREGPIVPLITVMPDAADVFHERHLCADTTAAGGNADLLAAADTD